MENENSKNDSNKNSENNLNDNNNENKLNEENNNNNNEKTNEDNNNNNNKENKLTNNENNQENNNNNKKEENVQEKNQIDENIKEKENSEKEESEELFNEIICKELIGETQKEENSKCFDCNNSPANWICVNNGIYLCATCAGEHRSYGNIISNIKFLLLDELNEFQISLMKISGNLRLKNLLLNYNVDYQNYDNLYLFSSKLLEWYRTVLYNTLIAQPFPKAPHQTLALQIMDNFKENKRPPIDYVVVEENEVKRAEQDDKNLGDISSIKKDNKNINLKSTLSNMSNCKNQ